MVSRIVAVQAVGKTIAGPGLAADVIVDGMGAAAAEIVFLPGSRPGVDGTRKTGGRRRIAVAGIAAAAALHERVKGA